MANEILSFQIGQCGNAIGLKFWKNMCAEHGLDPTGLLNVDDLLKGMDNKHAFYHESESGRFVPRSIMLDLEPRVVEAIRASEYRGLFDKRNMFVGKDGGGAGNNWATGYESGRRYADDLENLVRRETEAMDLMGGSVISHAISGGTGAGLGSYVLELLADRFPKKTVQTYSVFSGDALYGDVVIQPYNSLLTLSRLTALADSVVVLDNMALHRLASSSRFLPHTSFANINNIVSDVVTTSLAPIRFHGCELSSLSDVVLRLTPAPLLHFLMTEYTPVRRETSVGSSKTSVETVMRRLAKMRNTTARVVQVQLGRPHGHVAALAVVQGEELGDRRRLRQVVAEVQRKMVFLPWTPLVYQIAPCPRSPYLVHPSRVSGLAIVNHSSIVTYFEDILSQFGKLFKCKAYVGQMQSLSGFNGLVRELQACQQACEDLIHEYRSALKSGYPGQWKETNTDTVEN